MGKQSVKIDQMADAILEGLSEYVELANSELKKAVKKGGQTVKRDINSSAPVRTGKYSKSWRTRVQTETANSLSVLVYSPDRYMLAHLLEFGHAKRGGGRTRAFPHLAPAEAHGIQQMEEQIKRALQ
jgi:hypothetical protein